MCEYCFINEDGNSDDAKCHLGNIILKTKFEIANVAFYADEKTLHLTSDLSDRTKKIKIKYCPMCGRKL